MNQLENLIPQDLLEIVTSHDYEDQGGLLISSFLLDGDDEKIRIIVDTGDTDVPNQTWEILINDVKAEKIDINWASELSTFEDHYLLWEFTDEQTSLYFNGELGNGQKLLADLYTVHKLHFKHIDVEKYMAETKDLHNLDLLSFCNFSDGFLQVDLKKFSRIIINV